MAKYRCPSCKTQFEHEGKGEFLPFCSQRCKLQDLNRWASEKYAIPGEPVSDIAEVDVEGIKIKADVN